MWEKICPHRIEKKIPLDLEILFLFFKMKLLFCSRTINKLSYPLPSQVFQLICNSYLLIQGWLKTWIWQLWPKFVTFIPLWILGNDTIIICLSSKNMQFCKIKRLWLKNWACHAHLKFKIQKGVASLFFEPHPPNFGKICILYRWKNDIITIFK